MRRTITRFALLFHLYAALTCAQAPQNPKPAEDDIVKVYTDLVQTDVMVFDKQGRFVNGLKREDFELRIDGNPQPIGSLDLVRAGTASEDAQLAAARGTARPKPTATGPG